MLLKKSRLCIIIIAGFIFVVWPECSAGDDSDFNPYSAFRRACHLYAESNFEEAIKDYEEIIEKGYESSNIYYNLGNAYFKIGLLGKAILNYERARRLNPYDSGLRSNLEYAYSLREEAPTDRTRIWLRHRIDNFLDSFTIDGLTKSLSAVYLTVVLLMTVLIFRRGLRGFVLNAVTVLTLFFMAVITLLSINIYRTEHMRQGIVLAKEVNARFEPRGDATVHFRLYAGSRLCLLRTRGDWSQVKREDGKIGWVESSSYEII